MRKKRGPGRPRIGEKRLTQAERQVRYRAKKAQNFDEAVKWIRCVSEELADAGFPGGDRVVALASLRQLIARYKLIPPDFVAMLRPIEELSTFIAVVDENDKDDDVFFQHDGAILTIGAIRMASRLVEVARKQAHDTFSPGALVTYTGPGAEAAKEIGMWRPDGVPNPFVGLDMVLGLKRNDHLLTYEFELSYDLPAGVKAEDCIERLYEAGCGDATPGFGVPGKLALAFSRKETSYGSAIGTAMWEVGRAIPGAKLTDCRIKPEA